MDTVTAVMIAEGVEDADEAQTIAAWQHLVDSGVVWQLQGSFGRTARHLIEEGLITDGRAALLNAS